MAIQLRAATPADADAVFRRTRALNDHEGIEITDERLRAGLVRLLASPELGGVWMIERDGAGVGYAIVTFGYDLEFGGREGWLTELWIDEAARGEGAGAAAIEALDVELRGRGVLALHLQVRPDNPAQRLYARLGFTASPRVVMTRRLG